MRRLFIIVPILVVLLIVAILGLALLNVDKYRPRVQAELAKKLDRPVTLGHLGVRLFPLSIRVDSLTIGEAPEFNSTRPFATAGQVYVSASLFSLLRGSPDVKEINLERPQIELIRNPAGVWNFSTIGGNRSGGNQSGDLTLDELKITDGQAAVTDQKMNQPRSVYDHIDLKLADFAPGKQFGIDLGVHFPGQGKELLSFNGKAGPLQAGNTAVMPVNGKFSLEEVSLAGVNRFAPGTIPDQTDSVASGDGTISSQGELVACKGNIKLVNTIIHGAKLDYPIDAQYDLSDDRKSDNLQIRSSVVRLGPTSFSIAGAVDSASKPARLNVRLTTNNSSITELARLAGAFGVAFNPAYQVRGTVSADITAIGPATAPQMNGSLSGRQIFISGGEIRTPVSVPEIAMTLTPDVVRSNPFTAQSGATALNVAFALSHYSQHNNMLIDLTLKTNGANIIELLNMAKAYGVGAAQGITGSGTISLDVHAQGPLEQTAALVYSGTAQIPSATLVMKSSTEPLAITGANIQFAQSSAVVAANTLKAEGFLLNNLRTNAKFGTGTIQLAPVSAVIFGGKADGTVAIDTRPAQPLCSVKMKLAGVDTNALLSAVSSMKDRLYGSLAAETNTTFQLASGPNLAGTLNGTLNFAVTNGQIKGMNIMGELSRIGRFLGSAPAQSGSSTALRRLSGSFNIVNGVASTNNLTAALDAGSLSANGSMNLVSEGLDLHATAVLGSAASQSAGGAHVGGFLNTALANNKGELVLPVLVTGTMSHPLFAPDVQAIAKMKLNNLLPTSTDPSKLTSGLLGSVLGNKGGVGALGGLLGQQPANQQKQPNTKDAVGSLLQQLGKKKPPPKQ